MALLHGSWLLTANPQGGMSPSEGTGQTGGFWLWGERWQRVTAAQLLPAEGPTPDKPRPVVGHPYALAFDELLDWLRSLQASGQLALADAVLEPAFPETPKKRGRRSRKSPAQEHPAYRAQVLALPSYALTDAAPAVPVFSPYHSAATQDDGAPVLYPWQVEGLWLSPAAAIALLQSLPMGTLTNEASFLGRDLRFWSHVARWELDLLARSKFLPTLNYHMAQWQPLLDSSVDQVRLNRFVEQMPLSCRSYGVPSGQNPPPLAVPVPHAPQRLLQEFLSATLDAQIRTTAAQVATERSRATTTRKVTIVSPLQEWLTALSTPSNTIAAGDLDPLKRALNQWITPLQNWGFEQTLFRTCFVLHPPPGKTQDWQLDYGLQAIDDADCFIDAATIWNNPVARLRWRDRVIPQPQETFLMGLGLASRLYPPIEPTLAEPRPQHCRLDPQQAFEFIKSMAWRLQDSGLGVILPASLSSQGSLANRLGLKISAQAGKLKKGDRLNLQSLLNFQWDLTIGGQTISKKEFERLVALNTPLVEINGEWVELRPQDIRAAQTFFDKRQDQTTLSLEDALRIGTGDTQMIEKLPVVSFDPAGSLEELLNTLTGKRTVEPITEPDGFHGELRPYQARGVGWLTFLEKWGLGACLADDMGLGKTIQLIAFLLHLREQKVLKQPTLLVCPTSVLGNWEREVRRFGPALKTLVYHGDSRPKGSAFAKAVKNRQLVLTSYALVPRDLKTLETVDWQGVVLDEAQNIKNPDAKQSQAVRQLESQFRIALTGTPVENRLGELWSIMDFLNPGYLGPKNFFQRRFATPIERYGDTDSLKTLRSLAQPFILRRLKTDRSIIQDLPEKQEMTVFCGLSPEQASLYQTMVDQSLAEIEAADGIQRRGIILALLTKLKQICNHPAQFLKEDTIGRDRRSGKLLRLEEMLDELLAEGDRALIFTQFAEWGKLLQQRLREKLGQETLFLYGSTSKKQREEMVDRFQHDPQGPRLFILSLKAGGVGLNLTRANHVFHFDRWWNPAVENQATDRAFRIGQTRNVQVHKFVCSGTLEEKIHDLIESKKALAEQVVGAGENWLTELDTDQLRNLLLLDREAVLGDEE